jgi:molybdate transport system substrate-binding protein
MRRLFLSPLVLCLSAIFIVARPASSAELKVLVPRAIFTVLQEVGPAFERETGNKLNVEWGLAPSFAPRIQGGEAFDIVSGQPGLIDGLIKDGKVAADSKTPLVKAGTGVEVRAGARKPDVDTVDAFKRTLLEAKSIGYLKVAGVPQLIERLGMTDTLKAKTTIAERDVVSEMVAKGELELGIVVTTQILTTEGVALVGPLPAEIQIYIPFAAGVSAQSQAPEAARALLRYLASPAGIAVIKKQGMEPG